MSILNKLIEEAAKRAECIKKDGDYVTPDTGLLHCGVCNEPKQQIVKPNFRDPFLAFRECRCQREESQKEREELEQYDKEQRQKKLKSKGIKTEAFKSFTFDSDDKRNIEVSKLCCNYIRHWDEMEKVCGGLLFYGDVGGGKSFYAGCIANALIKRDVPVLFTSLRDLVDNRQAAKFKGEELIDLHEYRLFVLDDIGAEKLNRSDIDTAFSVIDDIYLLKKPLIVTTNLTISQLTKPTNQELARIYSRIVERCPKPVYVDNSRYNRTTAAAEKRNRIDDILSH